MTGRAITTSCQLVCKRNQAPFLVGVVLTLTATPSSNGFPSYTSLIRCRALSAREDLCATISSFQVIAWALSIFLKRRETSLLSRTALKGDSIMLVVRRWIQCPLG